MVEQLLRLNRLDHYIDSNCSLVFSWSLVGFNLLLDLFTDSDAFTGGPLVLLGT